MSWVGILIPGLILVISFGFTIGLYRHFSKHE